MKLRPIALATATALATILPTTSFAEVKVGQLTCHQRDSTNLLLVSEANFSCVYSPISGEDELYRGSITKVGLDLSTSKAENMVWFVFAPSDTTAAGALAGEYYGASGDASVGAGAGVRALVGGSDDSFSLQPASVSSTEGFGVAAGVEKFTLEAR